jgi:hypothetical protein
VVSQKLAGQVKRENGDNVASTAMAEARSFRRTHLPAPLPQRHTSISTNEQRVLRTLKDHTGLILRGIGSTIGQDLHLRRVALVQKVLGELETAQVVLVAGPASRGKSAIGKDAVALLSENHFVLGLRVEEFAQPHFDATLHAVASAGERYHVERHSRGAGPQSRSRGKRRTPARNSISSHSTHDIGMPRTAGRTGR